jgi:phage-related protein|nr:MAG TPA: distal tail protein [Caudoviricetes sp.]
MGYFIFNGKDSREFGILESVPIPPKAERILQTVEIPGRLYPLNKARDEFKNVQLSFVLGITDHSKINDINKWLNGSGMLILSNDTSKYYNAFVHSAISPERLSVRFGKIPIIFTVEPFRYDVDNPVISHIFTDIKDSQPEKTIKVTAGGSYSCEPLYFFRWAGRIEMAVNGGAPLIIDSGTANGEYTDTYTPSGNGTPIYHYLSPEATMFINTSLRLAYRLENGVRKVCCEMTSGKFPMLEPGENTVKFRLIPEYTWEHTMPDGTVRQYKHTEQKLLVFDVTPNTRWL